MTTEEVMTTEALWQRYAATWSLAAADRATELPGCVTRDVTYCDPNGPVEGRQALSDYMGAFQASVPGGAFRIRSVLHHHDRSLARSALHGPDGGILQTGTSFGVLADGGRLVVARRTPNLGEPLAKAAGPVRGPPRPRPRSRPVAARGM
jgi:hypothetical protein